MCGNCAGFRVIMPPKSRGPGNKYHAERLVCCDTTSNRPAWVEKSRPPSCSTMAWFNSSRNSAIRTVSVSAASSRAMSLQGRMTPKRTPHDGSSAQIPAVGAFWRTLNCRNRYNNKTGQYDLLAQGGDSLKCRHSVKHSMPTSRSLRALTRPLPRRFQTVPLRPPSPRSAVEPPPGGDGKNKKPKN